MEIDNDPLIKSVVRESVRQWKADVSEDAGVQESFDSYSRYIHHKLVFIAICVVLTFLIAGFSLSVGDYDIGFWETYQIVIDDILGVSTTGMKHFIVMDLRMPRLLTAIIAGVGLAIAGVAMQSTLLNPLADPYTTGVSSGALLGATLAMVSGISLVSSAQYGIVVNAFIFALIPMFVITFVAKIKQSSPTTMIMTGIAVMYIFSAVTTVIKLYAEPEALKELYEWQIGSLGFTKMENIPVMLAFVAAGAFILQVLSRKLNVLATGDESAKGLGIDADRLRDVILVVVSLVTAAVVSFTGMIGFVGLVAPHIVRLFIGADNKYLLPASAALGALLLVVSDLVGRTIIAPSILQVGVVTSFLGGPLFLWLIIRKKSNVW